MIQSMHLLHETFEAVTGKRMDKQALVAMFNHVRDLPYRLFIENHDP